MYYSESGDEWKKFNTRDGMGIKLLQRAGILTAIITQESTKIVMRRAQKLTIPEVHQGAFDKLAVLKDLIARHRLTMEQVAYIGDDVNDVQALGAVGFSAAPADWDAARAKTVRYVCQKKGRGRRRPGGGGYDSCRSGSSTPSVKGHLEGGRVP